MKKESSTETRKAADAAAADWQQAYLSTATALGASWCDFVGERFHAYAHIIDDISHCHDLGEAWQIQSAFGQQTARAYSQQATKLGGLMLKPDSSNAGGQAE